MRRLIAAIVAVLFLVPPTSAAQSGRRPVPNLGLVMNIDGDNAFRADTLEESQRLLRAEVDGYADVGAKTLAYCTGAGSEILLYPTKVADTWGWRKTKYDDDPAWGPRVERNRKNTVAGGDGPRTAGEQAKRRGMYFFPSQRMNDGHFAFGKPPEEYPLAGKFWLENRQYEIKDSPIVGKPEYGHLLDFTHDAVREYRLAQAYEAVDRYQDLMDGYELDFTRFQVFFPRGKAWERRELMTDLVRKVRERLDERGAANGKSYVLMVRVPPAPHNCRWAGLDVRAWAEQGLIDVLVPSQMMNMGFEQPIDAFKEMVGGYGVRVYSGLLPRVGWSWQFPPEPLAAGDEGFGTADRALSVPQLRAAATNGYFRGADGIYLFNFQHYAQWGKATSGAGAVRLADPASLARQDKVFSISKAYWFDHEDGYEYRKQLPAELPLGEARTFQLLVGEDLSDAARREALRCAILRLGLREAPPSGTIKVSFNGAVVLDGPLAEHAVATFDPANAAAAKTFKAQKDLAGHVVQIPLKDAAGVRRGVNEVTVEVVPGPGVTQMVLTDVDLGLFYDE